MPRIPTYEQQTSATADFGGRRAQEGDAFALGPDVGRALSGAGEVLFNQQRRDAAEAERKQRVQEAKDDRDAELRGATIIAKGRNDYLDFLNKASQKSMADEPDVVEAFTKSFDDFKAKAVEAETDPRRVELLSVKLDNLRASLLDNAMSMQAGRAGAAASAAVKDVFDQHAIAVQKAPNQLAALMAEETRLINSLNIPGLTDAARQRLVESRRHELPGMAVAARIGEVNDSRQAKALKTELETDPRWQSLLSGKQYASALNALNQDIKHYERTERAERVAALQERMRERAAGVDNGLSPREAGGDPKLLKAIASAEEIGKARTEVRGLSYADLNARLRDAEKRIATPGGFSADAAYASALQEAAAERTRALNADPASYTAQNSAPVRKAYDAMVSSEFSPESVRKYAAIATEIQRDMAGPGHTVRLLPKAVIDETVARVSGMPAEQAANHMEALQKQFGPMWTEVLSQMHGKVPPGFATLGRLTGVTDANTRVTLADALKAGPDLRKNLSDADARDADRKLEELLSPYARLVSGSGSAGQNVLREELAAGRALAYRYVAQGDAVNTAAKKAADALIFNRYDVGPTFLAPKGEMGLAQREAARVMRETPAQAFPPAPGGDEALSDGYRREASQRAALRGSWANVTDLSTGRLGIEWRNEFGAPVVLDNGDPVRLYFDEMRQLPAPARRGALPRGTLPTPGGAAVRVP